MIVTESIVFVTWQSMEGAHCSEVDDSSPSCALAFVASVVALHGKTCVYRSFVALTHWME